MQNTLKACIEKNGYCLGTYLGVANVPIIECLGYSGLDFVVIDTEHGPYDTQPMSDLIMAATRSNLVPIVRVGDVTHKEIQRAVDNGAQGIIAPCLKTIEDFQKVIDLAKYPPYGSRGYIKARDSGFGNEAWAQGTLEDYMKNSNDRVLVLPQCETVESLEHIEEIARLDGLDGFFIGPFDLSISMGIPAQFDNPAFVAALARIKKACKDAGKLCMIYANDVAESRRYIKEGYDAVADSIDSLVISAAYKKIVEEIKK